jgi:hypothetical protein
MSGLSKRRLSRGGLVHAVEGLRRPRFHVLVRQAGDGHGRRRSSPLLMGGCRDDGAGDGRRGGRRVPRRGEEPGAAIRAASR